MWDDDSVVAPAPVNEFAGNGFTSAPANGFYVGRGRGFGNMSSMSSALPEVGFQSKSTSQSNESAWQDDGWDDGPTTKNNNNDDDWGTDNFSGSTSYNDSKSNRDYSSKAAYSKEDGSKGYSNSRVRILKGGGGGRSCYNCGQDGHMSRDCPTKSRGGGGGGGRSKGCFKCGEEGHMSRDCPNSDSGGRSGGSRGCFKCGEEGHMSRDCPSGGSGGGRGSRACYKCGDEGHMSKDCPNSGSSNNRTGGGGSRACYKCGEDGHMAKDCPSGGNSRGSGCYKCHEEGHQARDCPNSGSGGGDNSRGSGCYKCHEEGHLARDCPNSGSGGGDNSRGSGCYKCHEEGHLARDCTKEVLGEDGKPRPPPYIPPDPTDDAETLFQGVPTGINFSKYDDIHVDVSGSNRPNPIDSFENSGLNSHILMNIRNSKYTKPTPVQKFAIPIILAKRDLMACAQTGSGKTAAFLLPILHSMIIDPDLPNNANNATQEPLAIIVAPTRELVIQIGSEARKFAYDSVIKADVLYGGTSTNHQSNRIKKGCHLLAATPGRLLDFVEKGKVSFSNVRYFVLDEADRMLDMGFAPAIRQMVEHSSMPQKGMRQTLMFSATFPEDIQRMAGEFLVNYLFLTVGMVGAANADVEQTFFKLGQFEKRDKLFDILKESGTDRTLVFVEQKRNADFIASQCSQRDIPTTSIHGDRLQREREEALRDFRSGKMPVMVATAVAARGLDIRDVRHVINFDLPQTIDEYVHRIGRTGRVGNLGKATSFYNPDNDRPLSRSLKKILIDAQQVIPDWLSEEADQAIDSTVQYSGRGNFGARDVRNKSRGKQDSSESFDNFNSAPPSNATFNEPIADDDECWG